MTDRRLTVIDRKRPMDRQHFLLFEDGQARAESARRFCGGRGLTARQIEVLCLICEQGERRSVNGQSLSVARLPKAEAGKRLSCSPNTFLGDVRDLEAIGLVGVLRNTRPWTYVANWSRVDQVDKPPDDPAAGLAELPVCRPVWSATVNHGQSRSEVRYSVKEDSLESVTVNRESVSIRDSVRGRPWDASSGVQDRELVAAVQTGELEPLRQLYREAVRLGWVEDTEDARLRFLTICHHAATCNGVGKRMGLLVARVKRELNVRRIRQESEEWASRILARAARPRAETTSIC